MEYNLGLSVQLYDISPTSKPKLAELDTRFLEVLSNHF